MSCATMPISPEDVLSAKSEGGSSLPLGGLPASSAGFLSLVQEVAILLSSMRRRINLKARRLSLRLTQRRAVRDAATHLVHRTVKRLFSRGAQYFHNEESRKKPSPCTQPSPLSRVPPRASSLKHATHRCSVANLSADQVSSYIQPCRGGLVYLKGDNRCRRCRAASCGDNHDRPVVPLTPRSARLFLSEAFGIILCVEHKSSTATSSTCILKKSASQFAAAS